MRRRRSRRISTTEHGRTRTGGLLPPSDQYLVQPGDILQITVWKEEDLQREVLVRPDGGLSFPPAGDSCCCGKNGGQIQKDPARALKITFPNPW
ncbi:MAG: polysaccharide biosynthesis/export family protein [Gammaproteobacteria bacterium]